MTLRVLLPLMTRLKYMDNHKVSTRDVLCLWAIRNNAGITGQHVAERLGYASRSNVQDCIARLVKKGYVEDRRDIEARFVPNDLHVTAKGLNFLGDLSQDYQPEN